MLWIFILLIALVSRAFEINYLKILVFYKFVRMFQIDTIFLRKLSVHRNNKALYIICKQIITIFILSHIIGLIFYLIDLSLLNSPACQQNSSRTSCPIQSAG